MERKIRLPNLGDTVHEARVQEINVGVGNFIEKDRIYMIVETGKADLDLPIQYSGWVTQIDVAIGDEVKTGQSLMMMNAKNKLGRAGFDRRDSTANVRAALSYLSKKDPDNLCMREALGEHTFPTLKPYVRAIIDIAKSFDLSLVDDLPAALIVNLQNSLFQVTDLIADIEGFDPDRIGIRERQHNGIVSYVEGNQQESIDIFFESWNRALDRGGRSKSSYNKLRMQLASARNRVFLIHGRNYGTKAVVARFLERSGFTPIILHEQDDLGKTIWEKFEDHSDVPFAIAIFTPDDVGASSKTPEILHPRVRQNVLFEFGFFVGKLGRKRVRALVAPEVELPSDLLGVLYIPLDDEEKWQPKLMRELGSVGLVGLSTEIK